MTFPTRLAWIDLEMTGLHPATDLITDVAVIITDFSLNELVTYQRGVSHPETKLKRLMANSPWHVAQPEYVEQMLEASRSGVAESVVEKEIVDLFREHGCITKSPDEYPHFPESLEAKGDVYLAGNSIGTDRAFIDAKWPLVARTLHYRMLDVSSFKLWHVGTKKEPFKKESTHRALDDIRDSIAEFKYYVGI